MSYIDPKDVHSPKKNWKLVDVVIDEVPADTLMQWHLGWRAPYRVSLEWHGRIPARQLAKPWPGDLDEKLYPGVIALAPKEKQFLISAYLNRPRRIELVVGRHPSGRFTLKEREENHGTYRYLQDDAPFGNLDQQG